MNFLKNCFSFMSASHGRLKLTAAGGSEAVDMVGQWQSPRERLTLSHTGDFCSAFYNRLSDTHIVRPENTQDCPETFLPQQVLAQPLWNMYFLYGSIFHTLNSPFPKLQKLTGFAQLEELLREKTLHTPSLPATNSEARPACYSCLVYPRKARGGAMNTSSSVKASSRLLKRQNHVAKT